MFDYETLFSTQQDPGVARWCSRLTVNPPVAPARPALHPLEESNHEDRPGRRLVWYRRPHEAGRCTRCMDRLNSTERPQGPASTRQTA